MIAVIVDCIPTVLFIMIREAFLLKTTIDPWMDDLTKNGGEQQNNYQQQHSSHTTTSTKN